MKLPTYGHWHEFCLQYNQYGNSKAQTDKREHSYNWKPIYTNVWQLLYDVTRASFRSSGRHIMDADLTPSLVGSMPSSCHRWVSWLKRTSSQDELHLCCSKNSDRNGLHETGMLNSVQCEGAIFDYDCWHSVTHLPSNPTPSEVIWRKVKGPFLACLFFILYTSLI